MPLTDRLPRAIDFKADAGEVDFARNVLAPTVAAVAATAAGLGVARACCGGPSMRAGDPKSIVPIGMALLTIGVAAWTYLNPQPEKRGR